MNGYRKCLYSLHPYLLSSIASILTIAQIILAFFFHGQDSNALAWIGWICVWAGGIFGTLPILIFRRKGKVPKGKSYINTTALVDSGLYAVVRHPQNGTAWLLINLGIIFIAWHWTSFVTGLLSMVLAYADTFKADQMCIEKFGDAYKEYMKHVPSVNPLVGAIRLIYLRKRS